PLLLPGDPLRVRLSLVRDDTEVGPAHVLKGPLPEGQLVLGEEPLLERPVYDGMRRALGGQPRPLLLTDAEVEAPALRRAPPLANLLLGQPAGRVPPGGERMV